LPGGGWATHRRVSSTAVLRSAAVTFRTGLQTKTQQECDVYTKLVENGTWLSISRHKDHQVASNSHQALLLCRAIMVAQHEK
jgi:hypothetical protein